jgi:hypothetical protein
MANKNKNGYVMIMLLVVIAIGLMIYYADMMWMGGGQPVKQEKPEEQPWANEALIKDPNRVARPKQSVAVVNSTKPVITKPLVLKGEVAAKDAKRGEVTFTIQPDGTLSGNWQCQYSYTHAAYVITATFKGNTDATQNAPDDTSKLYLIAKGDFVQKATNLESGEITETKGVAYFGGWIGSNFAASGTLSITTNKKWHADYTWTAKP